MIVQSTWLIDSDINKRIEWDLFFVLYHFSICFSARRSYQNPLKQNKSLQIIGQNLLRLLGLINHEEISTHVKNNEQILKIIQIYWYSVMKLKLFVTMRWLKRSITENC